MTYVEIPDKNEAISLFLDSVIYVFSLKFLYNFLFKEWETIIPSLK